MLGHDLTLLMVEPFSECLYFLLGFNVSTAAARSDRDGRLEWHGRDTKCFVTFSLGLSVGRVVSSTILKKAWLFSK